MRALNPLRLVLMAIAAGLTCASLACLASGQDPRWFSERHLNLNKNGGPYPYYEGVLDVQNGEDPYEILGLFAYSGSKLPDLDANPPENSALKAWFYVPKQEQGNPTPDYVTVWAKQIASLTNYLLQSTPINIASHKNEWTLFSWKAAPFISPYGIDPNDLAVLAELGTKDGVENDRSGNDILPVVFSLDCKDQRISHYEFLLIFHSRLAYLTYKVGLPGPANPRTRPKTCYFSFNSDSDACVTRPPNQGIEVGTVVQLFIPVPVSVPAGPVSLHIRGKYVDSSAPLDLKYRFFHQRDFQCTQ